MKDFLTYNWKTITLTILGVIFFYLLVRTLMPVPVPSELNKYKLEQIDKKIKDIEKLQKEINDSINSYQKQIKGIDTKISNIKIERSQINNYYTIKEEEIKNADRKKIDSLLRKRYNF
jgi:septal ring factor EnvC (AmiA/AmiB activator)